MRDINEVAKKMARNGLKIAKLLGCAFHFESEFSSKTDEFAPADFLLVIIGMKIDYNCL